MDAVASNERDGTADGRRRGARWTLRILIHRAKRGPRFRFRQPEAISAPGASPAACSRTRARMRGPHRAEQSQFYGSRRLVGRGGDFTERTVVATRSACILWREGPLTIGLENRDMDRQPILVIGGTRGTGLLIAQLLSRSGAAVRVLARDPARASLVGKPPIEVVQGDLTREDTLPAALDGVRHIVFTAGRRSGRPSSEDQIRLTEYDGVRNTLVAAKRASFAGRFLYMTASGGVGRRSFWSWALNLYKGDT